MRASDGVPRQGLHHHLFPTELILQRGARSDDADKLGADFMAALSAAGVRISMNDRAAY
jgi:hypothetical protein